MRKITINANATKLTGSIRANSKTDMIWPLQEGWRIRNRREMKLSNILGVSPILEYDTNWKFSHKIQFALDTAGVSLTRVEMFKYLKKLDHRLDETRFNTGFYSMLQRGKLIFINSTGSVLLSESPDPNSI